MKRATKSLIAAGLVAILVVPTASQSQAAPKRRSYSGTTEQGYRMSIDLVRRSDGRFWIKTLAFRRLDVICEGDQTVQRWGVEAFFGGLGEPLDGRTLELDRSDQFNIFRLNGHFRALHASGDIEYAVPAFTEGGELQACTTGVMPWTADRTVPPPDGLVRHTTGQAIRTLRAGEDKFTFVRYG